MTLFSAKFLERNAADVSGAGIFFGLLVGFFRLVSGSTWVRWSLVSLLPKPEPCRGTSRDIQGCHPMCRSFGKPYVGYSRKLFFIRIFTRVLKHLASSINNAVVEFDAFGKSFIIER